MKINWKDISGMITVLLTISGGFYKLNEDNKQILIENQSVQKVKHAQWQIDSLRMERKIQELRWDMRDSIRIEIARFEDKLKRRQK